MLEVVVRDVLFCNFYMAISPMERVRWRMLIPLRV